MINKAFKIMKLQLQNLIVAICILKSTIKSVAIYRKIATTYCATMLWLMELQFDCGYLYLIFHNYECGY